MANENKWILGLLGNKINGIDEGGPMSIVLDEGYAEIYRSPGDGNQVAVVERNAQYVRGVVVTQDWLTVLSLLTGTLGTYVYYVRNSGVAAATGYTKHTLTNPVIYAVSIKQSQGSNITVTFSFECRFATAAATISTVHAVLIGQALPAQIDPERNGWRVLSTVHGVNPAINLFHVTAFDFGMALPLARASNDAWKGHGAVDVDLEGGLSPKGSISAQDFDAATAAEKKSQLLLAARGPLIITLTSEGGAANKVVTIAGVVFIEGSSNFSSDRTKYADWTLNYEVSNDLALPLTLAGDNNIITIEDAE